MVPAIRKLLVLACMMAALSHLTAQRAEINDLLKKLNEAKDDSSRWFCNIQLSANYLRINFDSSRMYGERSLALSGNLGNGLCRARSLNTLGAAYWSKGDHEPALRYYFDALELAEKSGLKPLYSTILGNIGLIYTDRKETEKALDYLRHSLKVKQEIKDTIGLLRTLNNIGKAFHESNQLDSALAIYKRCLPYFEALPAQKQGKGIVLNNIGAIYLKKSDYAVARTYFEQSLVIRREIGDKGGQAVVLTNLGESADDEGKTSEAIRYYEQSLQLSEETGSGVDLLDIWKKLSAAYARTGKFEQAYNLLQKFTLKKDSQYLQESAANIANMEVKYQTAKKEAEIKALESENRIRNFINYGALAGILALLIVLWLSRRTYRQRRQLQQATIERLESERKVVMLNAHLEGQQRERVRIAEDLHDDFGSGLSKISLLSELVKKKLPGTPELDKISAAAKELLLKMGEIVWALNHRNDTLPSLTAYIRRYASGFFEDTEVRCIFNLPEELPEVPLSGETRRNVFLVIKECLHNILKHAKASRATIDISFKNNTLNIEIHDNGDGFDPEAGTKAGNGLINMKSRMEQEGGQFQLYSLPGQGTTTSISLPLPNEAISNQPQTIAA